MMAMCSATPSLGLELGSQTDRKLLMTSMAANMSMSMEMSTTLRDQP